MYKIRFFIPFLLCFLLAGCGPDTIFVRPGLDTPSRHVAIGNQLLERGKLDDACREFIRAKELDPQYVQAHVGLGIALGRKGQLEAGLEAMDQARQMAQEKEDVKAVQKGFEVLYEIKRRQTGL